MISKKNFFRKMRQDWAGMKRRIKINRILLPLLIVFTGFLFQFPSLYSKSIFGNDILNYAGLFIILAGTLVRMAARGHKKAHSYNGGALVTTGPYGFVRHPMYLGIFLISSGFILMIWPWWTIFIWTGLFYFRFKIEIAKEENHLRRAFGSTYEMYVQKVPLVLPRWGDLKKIRLSRIFRGPGIWETDEKRGLILWPVLAVLLEILQQHLVFGFVPLARILVVLILSMLSFYLSFWRIL